MKYLVPAIIFIFLSHTLFSCDDSKNIPEDEGKIFSSVVQEYGQLKVEGNKIVSSSGNPIQLRGMSLFWSQWMGQYYTKEVVQWLKTDWQCTVIRASMGVDEDGGYIFNKAVEKQKIFTVIDAAIAEGIYVIVDWHSHHAEDYTAEAVAFFSEVAQKYGDTPNLIYEIYNEPLENVSWNLVLKPYHEEVIAAIRLHDPDTIIICGTPSWSQRVDQVIGNTIADDNIAYALHYYAATHKQELRDIAQQAIDNNIALFVTEYGITEYTGDGFIDVNEANIWWNFLDKNQISWCNWSVADKEESSAILLPGTSSLGNWSENNLSQSGRIIRAEIKKKNPNYQK
ncbi:MAG: glycoside hydrolase family 5 protein [Flavobacteriaceae bacterium]